MTTNLMKAKTELQNSRASAKSTIGKDHTYDAILVKCADCGTPIGVPHGEPGKERTQDQIDFDEALDAYLDVHAGKLFNGDE
jgi:hypothetical protein